MNRTWSNTNGAVVLAFLTVVFATSACSTKPPSEGDYIAQMRAGRATRDAAFKSAPEPVPEALKTSLLPLLYYPVDSKYDIAAAIAPSDNAPPQPMVYSD